MGRGKKRRGGTEPPSPSPVPQPRFPGGTERTDRSGRTARAVGLAVAAVALSAVAFLVWGRVNAPIVLPPPRPMAAEPAVRWEDFIGADACGQCHRAQYDAWQGSTHGRAGGAPSSAVVIARFNGVPMRFRDATVTPRVTAGKEYRFVVSQPGRADVAFTVTGVIGGGHLVGGGTQGFVARFEDGTVRFLPFDFVRREGVWFCNTIGRGNRGWAPITPDLPLEACVDWPPQRILGTHARFSNCQECHGSQIELRYDAAAKAYDTRYRDLRINCESCHGPGRRHVELARSGGLDSAADIGLRSLTTLTKDQSLAVCFQCHALKDVLAPDYLPGESLPAHYSLGLSALGERPWFPDGRVRTFAYQQNHRFSDCYLSGSMTCTDCHDPHSQQYRDIWGARLSDRFADAQCTDCHASKADRVAEHTHHAVASPGSRCVACHMPYLQHPELGKAVRFTRSDHTIAIPRPAFDAGQGLDGACQQCHRDRGAAQLDAAARAWWGDLKPQPALVSALAALPDSARIAAGEVAAGDRVAGDVAAVARRLLRPDLHHPLAQIEALGELLDRYLEPDMPGLDGEIIQRLERLAGSDDPDVRGLALATLHFAAGDRRAVRRFLARALDAVGDEERLIRSRWRIVLAYLGDARRVRGDMRTALVAYGRALEIAPGDAAVMGSMGLAYAGVGDWVTAAATYRRSLAIDPRQPLTLVNLGLSLEAQNDAAGAVGAYEQALAVNPREAVALLNLGNVYFRRGDHARAIELYRGAIAANGSLAPAHFNLARAYALTGQLGLARTQVERGLAFDPESGDGQAMLAELERVLQPQ